MIKDLLKSQKGQTSVEYLLLIAVSIGLGVTFYKRMNEYLLQDGTGYFSRQLRSLEARMTIDPDGRYRRYDLPRI